MKKKFVDNLFSARRRLPARGAWIVICLWACAALPLSGCGRNGSYQPEAYWRTATYFSDGWCLNFWNLEWDNLEEELEQIYSDGFNSILVVIPWREFQPDIEEKTLGAYQAERLDELLSAAERQGLGVVFRVGYTWDYTSEESAADRYHQIMGDPVYQEAWFSYLRQLYDICHAHSNFLGGFICWEDFWSETYRARDLGAEGQGLEEAAFTGYQDYLRANVPLEEVSRMYGEDFSDYGEVDYPAWGSPAMGLYYDFYDDFLRRILEESQEVFPNLSMEVRLDMDVVWGEDGETDYYSHESTYGCGTSDYTCAMYGIPMGFANQGERLSWQEALEGTEWILNDFLEKNSGKPLYIDQFLYMDNTAGFGQNAQIREDELASYLENVDGVLKEYTMGYCVWVYRDYALDMIYNRQFALGLEGWETEGEVAVIEGDSIGDDLKTAGAVDSNMARLEAGALLRQRIPVGRKSDTGEETISVSGECVSLEPVTLTVSLGEYEKTFSVEGGKRESFLLEFPNEKNYTLEIQADGQVYIDNLKAYAHIQSGRLYGMDGGILDCRDSIRRLNEALYGTSQ